MRVVQRIAFNRIDHTGGAARTVHRRCIVIIGCDRASDHRYRCGSGRAVGRVQVLTDRVVEAVSASRGARINRDVACCRVKAKSSRNTGAGCNRNRHLGAINGRPIEGVVAKHVQDIGGSD